MTLGKIGKAIDYPLQAFFILSGIFTSINAHLFTISLVDFFAELSHSNAHDEEWKEKVIESAALIIAAATFVNFISYNYIFLKKNGKKIAASIENKEIPLDKNTLKTLGVLSFPLLISPFLSNFYMGPSIKSIPYLQYLIKEEGIDVLIKLSAGTQFVNTAVSATTIYAYFAKTNRNESNQLPTTIKYPINISGIIESLMIGSTTFVAIMSTANKELNQINPYGPFVVFGAVCAASQVAQNWIFQIGEGTAALAKLMQPQKQNDPEAAILLTDFDHDHDDYDEEEVTESVIKATTSNFYSKKNAITLFTQPKQPQYKQQHDDSPYQNFSILIAQ